MTLGLVAMSGLRVVDPELAQLGLTLPGFIERKKVIASLPSLGLLTLAALTPESITVRYLEQEDFTENTPLPEAFDIVAISSFTAQISATYRLADAYRRAGTRVILGGLHVTALPEEALQHADTVLLGEAEPLWAQVMHDAGSNALQRIYDARHLPFDLADAPLPRYDLLDPHRYNRLTVQTQRGCPYHCEFCASSILLSPRYKTKPIENIGREIAAIKAIWPNPFIELADDNTFADKRRAKALIRTMAEHEVKWFTETDVSIADDPELLDMLSDSGCRQLLIGFESPASGLEQIERKGNWKAKQQERYGEAIAAIQRRGISVNGCFILGLDGQDASIFDAVYDFVRDSGLAEVQITLQTPFPGTALYARLKAENRLLAETFWDRCTLFDVTYHPDRMTVSELETGFRDLMRRLYDEPTTQARKRRFVAQAQSRYKAQ